MLLLGLRLLAIAPDYLKNSTAEGNVNRKLLSALRANGAIVDVVSQSSLHRPVTEFSPRDGSEAVSDMGGPWSRAGGLFGELRRIAGLPFGNLGFRLRGSLNETYWALAAASCARRLVAQRHYDLIVSFTGIGHLAATFVQGRAQLPWMAVWNDPFPVAKYPPPYGRGADAEITVFHRRLLRSIGQGASWHIFPTERLRRYMLSFLPAEVSSRSSVIPHIAASTNCGGDPGGRATFVLSHVGDLHEPRRPEAFLLGLRDFRMRLQPGQGLMVRFIGKDLTALGQQVERHGLGDIIQCAPRVPYEESLALMQSSDVLVVLEANLSEGIFLPAKFVDYIQADRPILALSPRYGVLADLLTVYGGGITADCSDPEAISRALASLHSRWLDGSIRSHYRSEGLKRMFAASTIVPAYGALFRHLLNKVAPE